MRCRLQSAEMRRDKVVSVSQTHLFAWLLLSAAGRLFWSLSLLLYSGRAVGCGLDSGAAD